MRIGGTPDGPNSNDTHGGINGTPLLFKATDMVRDLKTNRLYISDGYGNRHVLIVDADTGKYIATSETAPRQIFAPAALSPGTT